MKLEERETIKMFNHWEIHEVEGHIVFVEISNYASRCLYMDKPCEKVVAVRVFKNPSPYIPPTEEIEQFGEEVIEHENDK